MQRQIMHLLSGRKRQLVPSSLSPGTSLCARSVVDRDGDVLGSVVDLLLDLEHGRIAYAVVASGGFMGIAERLVAVPWNALMPTARHFVLQGNRSVFESGPEFEHEQWNRTPSRWWHERVHAHFRSRPYW
jgi:uncharacterized protein YrrD